MLKDSLPQRLIREDISIDGVIANVTNAPNGSVDYTYFDLGIDGYDLFTMDHVITNTTLTIESTNISALPSLDGGSIVSCSSTDGSGATLVASTLNSTLGFVTDDDLIGSLIEVVADATTPANVGLTRLVTDYAQSSGTLTLSSALTGASTSGVTQFKLLDNPQIGGRLASDPPGKFWRDITTLLTGAATHTTSGKWIIDNKQKIARIRIKQARTSGTNSCLLVLCRGR